MSSAFSTDAIGQSHPPFAKGSARIVSLVPSLTELIVDLGLADSLVGRTGFCIHPQNVVKPIPKVGGTKDVNLDKIRKLAPTHVVLNIDENEKPVADALAQFVPHVIVTHPLTLRDNLDVYRLFGQLFGVEAAAQALCDEFEAVYARFAQSGTEKQQPPLVYCIWKDPWMTISASTYIADMLRSSGRTVWHPSSEQRYPAFSWEEALQAGVGEVWLSTEPYRFQPEHVDALAPQLGIPVRLADGEMCSWYGSRAIAGMRYLMSE
ncbi:helical backbone metal receptor [Undibacterium luofuense]|uniref:ABC transporter substrate-binding protein n=1 Tax=Undibacterium luofuense TaxID=2828733 RepID=A0A941DI79_9BURK|nr:helical backbone metal receptor [Undibacterium luofuense]MBR7780524.1 ABC transporter substrate-binding protein [Undibacterium luofuense]